jgi:hypothetical protein
MPAGRRPKQDDDLAVFIRSPAAMPDVLKFDSLAPFDAPPVWLRLRRQPRTEADTLCGSTRQWLRQLPPRRRPLRLCEMHPRVANRIAWCWSDAALTDQVLQDLVQDRRGGRRGFPPVVVRELQRLCEFNDAQRVELHGESLWEAFRRMAAGH